MYVWLGVKLVFAQSRFSPDDIASYQVSGPSSRPKQLQIHLVKKLAPRPKPQ